MIAVAYTKLLRRKRLLESTQTAFHILAAVGCGRMSKSKSSTLSSLCIRRENTIIKGFHGTAAYKEIDFERRKQRRRRTGSKSMLLCWPRAVLASHRSQVSPRRPIPLLHINIRVLMVLIHFAISYYFD